MSDTTRKLLTALNVVGALINLTIAFTTGWIPSFFFAGAQLGLATLIWEKL